MNRDRAELIRAQPQRGWLPHEAQDASNLLDEEIRIDLFDAVQHSERVGYVVYAPQLLPKIHFRNGTVFLSAVSRVQAWVQRWQLPAMLVFNERFVAVDTGMLAEEIARAWYGDETAETLQPLGIALNAIDIHGNPVTVQNSLPQPPRAAPTPAVDVISVAVPPGMHRGVLQQLIGQVIDMWNVAKIHAEAQQVRAETGTPLPNERTRAIDLGGSHEQS